VVLLREGGTERPRRRELALGEAHGLTLGPTRSPDLGKKIRSHHDLSRDDLLQLPSSVPPLGKHPQYSRQVPVGFILQSLTTRIRRQQTVWPLTRSS